MILNVVPDALAQPSKPGSLYFRHLAYMQRWWWREFNRVSYLGGREYYRPNRLTVEFQEPDLTQPRRNSNGQLVDPRAVGTEIPSLLFRHSREKSWEYENRRKRAHYHNVVKSTVNSLVSHALKKGVIRADTDPVLNEFWKGVDEKRQIDIDSFTRNGLRWAQCQGIMWACVDTDPADVTGSSDGNGKPYTYWVSPLDIFDWCVGDDGQLDWIKQFIYVELPRSGPREPFRAMHRFRVWFRDRVEEWDVDPATGTETVSRRESTTIGRVPFEPLFSQRNEEAIFPDGDALITDFAKGANSVFNYTSLLNEIIYKQTFSWLTIPDKNVDAIQISTGTVFGYDAQGGGKPEYISPDAEQARVLLEVIGATAEQMRQALGVGRGRSESSKQQQAAAALELENEDKRSILGDICSEGQDFERRLAALVLSYKRAGAKPDDVPHIQYPKDFDLRAFKEEVDEALSMRSLGMSPEIDLELRRLIAARKFTGMPPDELAALVDTLQKRVIDITAGNGQGVDKTQNQPGANAGDGQPKP